MPWQLRPAPQTYGWAVRMVQRIHIFGASGSGTTTLAKAIADKMGIKHYDTDNYFWKRTDPPYQTVRERDEREELLRLDLNKIESWVLSGSLCGWGDFAIPLFDLVIFLYLPMELRIQRLNRREMERFGSDIGNYGHPWHQNYKKFIEWAASYDNGGLDMRSKSSHEKWISQLPYSVVRIESDRTIQENLNTVLNRIFPNELLQRSAKISAS